MIQAYYEFCHGIGLHLWDIPALIVLVFTIIYLVVHRVRQNKREKEFEDELKQMSNTLNVEDAKEPTQV